MSVQIHSRSCLTLKSSKIETLRTPFRTLISSSETCHSNKIGTKTAVPMPILIFIIGEVECRRKRVNNVSRVLLCLVSALSLLLWINIVIVPSNFLQSNFTHHGDVHN